MKSIYIFWGKKLSEWGYCMTLTVFHGTKTSVVKKIEQNGFIVKHNKEHWLGNGVYFFVDKELAKWWSSNPTRKFGLQNKESASILEYELCIDEKVKVLDLRTLNGYKKFAKMFKDLHIIFAEMIEDYDKMMPIQAVICSVFDTFFAQGIEVIIGSYYIPKQPYLDNVDTTLFKHTGLAYFEVQICVKEELQKKILNFKRSEISNG